MSAKVSYSRFFSMVVACSFLFFFFTEKALCKESSLSNHHAYTSKLVEGKNWNSANQFIEKVYQQASRFDDYVFESNMKAKVKNKVSKNGGKFYYKKNRRLRIEVKSKGRNNGAVVVKKRDGTIRGAGGGMLKFIKMTLQPNSRMLILPNGYNVTQTDFKSLIQKLKAKIKTGSVAKVTTEGIYCYKWSGKVRVIDVRKNKILTDRILVSSKYSIPIEWDNYKNGKLISVSLFKNFRKNVGLADSLFKL